MVGHGGVSCTLNPSTEKNTGSQTVHACFLIIWPYSACSLASVKCYVSYLSARTYMYYVDQRESPVSPTTSLKPVYKGAVSVTGHAL